ncbi:unnamed protein product [Cyclocybe aegerita]|uniref:BTB domain-containing protein n=1 Tax=Cyclocybe aegerita TaxID=1973307 RepID=A0A8S0WRQ1_CYCAE|nr:unnamed protein product [Cyclocybe aegerita]
MAQTDEPYAQGTSPIASLRAILHDYIFSVGIFRELLQNSDDAGASKQIFVLDRRTHSSERLYHPKLADAQGPALLAFNDAVFKPEDWEALKNQYESSKVDDSSKIGKYGVGFRSVFHITDCPQVLSDKFLAVFDPLYAHMDRPGAKFNVMEVAANFHGQLAPFEWFWEPNWTGTCFKGTVVRCPLRKTPSRISNQVVSPAQIHKLFTDFIERELDILLLFLSHIKEIEIHDVDSSGKATCLAKLSMARSEATSTPGMHTHKATTMTIHKGVTHEKTWRISRSTFSQAEAVQRLSATSSGNTDGVLDRVLQEHKLLPEIGIAADVSAQRPDSVSTRLFTYLPLPVFTRYPVHIHALFAINRQRNELRNPREIGVNPGTTDHILIEWNKLLFNRYIPEAWKIFMETAICLDNVANVFTLWPPSQAASGNIGLYAPLFAKDFLRSVLDTQASVWPVFRQNHEMPLVYESLDQLITVEPGTLDTVLRSLTKIGLQLTCPPRYVFDLIKAHGRNAVLTPEVANTYLRKHLDVLAQASEKELNTILEYLLSTREVLNLVGLPLVPLASGIRVSLELAGPQASKIYTILTRQEFDAFGSCDDEAIPLEKIPMVARSTFHTAPEKLNVEALQVPRIIHYLTLYPNRLGLDLSVARTDPRASKWLSNFWVWMNKYPGKMELFPQICHLFLLPSMHGLRKAEAPLFQARNESPLFVKPLSSLGVPFLDEAFDISAYSVLMHYGLLTRIIDIHALLNSIPLDRSPVFSANDCTMILKLLAQSVNSSYDARGQFSDAQRRKLRQLPIYPVLGLSTGRNVAPDLETVWTSIPEGRVVKSISDRPPFVPIIDGLIFVGLNSIAPNLLKHLEPEKPASFTNIELLELAINDFTSQSPQLQAAALAFVVQNKSKIPPYLLDNIKCTEFVRVLDGSLRRPDEVVNPQSTIASLFDGRKDRPRMESRSEEAIVKSLASLDLMKAKLTLEVVKERIGYLSANHSSADALALSHALLSLIAKTNLDFSKLALDREECWLPTAHGVRSPKECRDAIQHSRYLFDRVLALVEGYSIPASLKSALGWDQFVETDVLIRQLDKVLGECGDTFDCVVEVIKELSLRNYDEHIEILKAVTKDRKWVPTTNRGKELSDAMYATFMDPIPDSGFSHILDISPNAEQLLRKLGCQDRPSVTAINARLRSYESKQGEHLSPVVLKVVCNLLRSLPKEIPDEERSTILIPDSRGCLRSLASVLYNDIGENTKLLPPDADSIAHPDIDESLAQRLGIKRLGLKYADLQIPLGRRMGETPVTTVRKNLNQHYNIKQFPTEFLANAADAHATQFALLANDCYPRHLEGQHALSQKMASFCTCPSLIVYNNAMFSAKDFEGICETSIGGKASQADTIGRFGLGALTMFYFTELAIIVSGLQVLFINPSKAHLPISEHAMLLSLSYVRKFYPAHFACIDGLFGFDLNSTDEYNGTIFILPLRQMEHCAGAVDSVIFTDFWDVGKIEHEVHDYFRDLAPNCLFFTKIEVIDARLRNAGGIEDVSWQFHATRTEQSAEGMHRRIDVNIRGLSSTTSWKVVSRSVARDQIPSEVLAIQDTKRMLVVQMAIPCNVPVSNTPFQFFAILPLGMTTSLPMHISAPFILSPDRRGIRHDEYGNPESEYNIWLLSHVVPDLYFFALEQLIKIRDVRPLFPGLDRGKEDTFSRLVVDGFYSKLKTSTRSIFSSAIGPLVILTPQITVLSEHEPPSVKRALSLLGSSNIVTLPGPIRELAIKAGLARVDPAFVKEEILRGGTTWITDELSEDFKIIEDIVEYLTDKGQSAGHVLGLQLIPLEDGTFGTIGDKNWQSRYFVWKPKTTGKPHNFDPRHFVHPKFKAKDLLKLDLNVGPLDPAGMKQFFEERFFNLSFGDVGDIISSINADEWVDEFWTSWEEYERLGLKYADISQYAVVPTLQQGRCVSLEQCKSGAVLIVAGTAREKVAVRVILNALGVDVIRPDDDPTPPALRSILQLPEFPPLKFETFLSRISSFQDLIPDKFSQLEPGLADAFATWARNEVAPNIQDDLLSVAQELPIWMSALSGSGTELRSASAVHCLPDALSREVAAEFLNVPVSSSPSLKHLKGPSISFSEIQNYLALPASLNEEQLTSYKRFLEIWLINLPNSSTDPIQIPTPDLTIRYSNDLYARHQLFLAAFGDASPNFVHPDFRDLEPKLSGHGLRNENDLDAMIFQDCVASRDLTQGEDRVARAVVLFDTYCTQLPLRVAADDQTSWRLLDDLAFVPRRMEDSRRLEQGANQPGLEIPDTVTDLEEIVSPNELVRQEFEAIAWSQRASFLEQPHQRVLVAHPGLGKPSFTEVLAHLCYLASLREVSSAQRRVLLHDLEATYRFMNDNAGFLQENPQETASVIERLREEKLFLNVDDPATTSNWLWDNADSLAFVDADDEHSSIRSVREFLKPFEKILLASGVVKVHHPVPMPKNENAADDSSRKLRGMYNGFQELRRKKVLVDVVFIGYEQDEDEDESLVAHRVFLAVSSDYFADTFSSGFEESLDGSPESPIPLNVSGHSRKCVRLVLDFIYTNRFVVDNFSLDLLLSILELSHYWRVTDLFEDVQRQIVNRKLINPDTLERIRALAERLNAEGLLQRAEEYSKTNEAYIRKLQDRRGS